MNWYRTTAGVAWLLAFGVLCGACEQVQKKDPVEKKDPAEQPGPDKKKEPTEPVSPRADGKAIEYTLRFPKPQTHHVEVEAVYPTGGKDAVELFMAVWTPGSYLVREYARHVETLSASTLEGESLGAEKIRKNRWRVQTGGAERVVVRYRLYARDMTVRTNFVDSSFGMLNGAATFISLVGAKDRPHDVLLEMPPGWKDSRTQLEAHSDGKSHHYVAEDFAQLVDSPIVMGTPAIYEMKVEGAPHVFANFGEDDVWDGQRAASDVKELVGAHIDFWGSVPYDRYLFMNMLVEDGGGLEHMNSTLMMTSRWATRDREDYIGWLGLVSHEFFHTWNVKRMHPKPLGPFDYENEVYTRSLWIVEGITSYYDDLLLRRAGLLDREEYFAKLSSTIEAVQKKPGRLVQPLAMSSYDAWIKFYRPHAHSWNNTVNYYRKGAVVAFLLDAKVRKATNGEKSLDDVMRTAYERFAGGPGFTEGQFRSVAEEVAGTELDEFFARHVDRAQELDYGPAFDYFGLQFEATASSKPPREGGTPSPERGNDAGYLGVKAEPEDGQLTVQRIRRGSPAYDAGLNVDDELIALDGYRVPPDGLKERLGRYRPGEEVTVLVARRGKLRRIDLTLGEAPRTNWDVQVASDATGRQRLHLKRWLGTLE
jgi:predicted metalloprotease with PDZ domain